MKGFTTRKMSRLAGERKCLEARLGRIEAEMERLLMEARRCRNSIAKVDESIQKLTPRLKCERLKCEEVKPIILPKIEYTELF